MNNSTISGPRVAPLHDVEQYPLNRLGQAPQRGTQRAPESRLSQLAKSLKSTGGQLLSDSLSQLPSARSLGAMAGHAVQQLITCGATTMAREEVFMHAYHSMLPVMEGNAKWALLAAQGAISLATVSANLHRQDRLHRLDDKGSSVNVRGHFGLSPEQWQAKTPEEKRKLTEQHQTDSRNVTRNAVLAEAGYMVMSALSLANGDGALASRVLATQLRNLTYAGTREFGQASIALTTSEHGKPTHGVNESHMAANAWTYTAMTLAMGYLQDAVLNRLLPAGQSVAGPAVRDEQGQALRGKELTGAINLIAGVRALANTGIEIMDAYRGKHYDLKQAGDQQKLQTDVSKMFPLKDYERLLDHSPARLSWNNISNATVLAASEIANLVTQGKMPAGASQLLSNLGTAAMFGMQYRSVNSTYNAHGKNRAAVKAEQTNQTQQTEGASGAPTTARPKDARKDSQPLLDAGTGKQPVESDFMMSGANGPGQSSEAGPGPSTQAAAAALFERSVENVEDSPIGSLASTAPVRNWHEARGASLQAVLESNSRQTVKEGKRPVVREPSEPQLDSVEGDSMMSGANRQGSTSAAGPSPSSQAAAALFERSVGSSGGSPIAPFSPERNSPQAKSASLQEMLNSQYTDRVAVSADKQQPVQPSEEPPTAVPEDTNSVTSPTSSRSASEAVAAAASEPKKPEPQDTSPDFSSDFERLFGNNG